jgi:hypothetical protein
MKQAHKSYIKSVKKWFPIYVVIVISVVFLLNSYEIPTTSYNTGEVRIGVGAPVCGDAICSYGEDTTCCSDCACAESYECIKDICVYINDTVEYRKNIHFSTPNFTILPESHDITLTLDEEMILDYFVRNDDNVRISVYLSVSEGEDLITIDPAVFWLNPSETGEFKVKVSQFEEFGSYSAQIKGESGRSIVTSDLSISVGELGFFKREIIKELQYRSKFNFIWLIVPISIAILLYLYAVKYKVKQTHKSKKK